MRHVFELDHGAHRAWLARHCATWRLLTDDGGVEVSLEMQPDGRGVLTFDGHAEPVAAAVDGDEVHVQIDGRTYTLRYRDPVEYHAIAADAGAEDVARAPMPGVVLSVAVAAGAPVAIGDPLLTIESMKLQTTIRASRDGTVAAVHVAAGQSFERDAALVTLRAAG
jgi:3-methylcrotonyl-CoA carboxylase alpha subunit